MDKDSLGILARAGVRMTGVLNKLLQIHLAKLQLFYQSLSRRVKDCVCKYCKQEIFQELEAVGGEWQEAGARGERR